jgi:hypothetical protein
MYPRAKALTRVTPVLFAICSTLLCGAQTAKKEKADREKTQTVTGCLDKDEETQGFFIVGAHGKVWELHSKQVSLAEHRGHTVAVTGTVISEAGEEDEDEGNVAGNEKKAYADKGHTDLRVQSVKMVGKSCK